MTTFKDSWSLSIFFRIIARSSSIRNFKFAKRARTRFLISPFMFATVLEETTLPRRWRRLTATGDVQPTLPLPLPVLPLPPLVDGVEAEAVLAFFMGDCTGIARESEEATGKLSGKRGSQHQRRKSSHTARAKMSTE